MDKDDGTTEYVDARDEDQCNWMMFVRPAANPAEQNLVTYQHGGDIYFTVIKNIEARQELKVGRRLMHWPSLININPFNASWSKLLLFEGFSAILV